MVPFPTEAGKFSVLQRVQTDPEAHTASYAVGTEDFFLRLNQPKLRAEHSFLSGDESICTSIHPYPYNCTVCTRTYLYLFNLHIKRRLTKKRLHLKFVSLCIIIQFKQINQPDATISPVYYLTFTYSSTCFGRPHAHHQELNNCSSGLWFYLRSVVIAVLLVVVGQVMGNRSVTHSDSP